MQLTGPCLHRILRYDLISNSCRSHHTDLFAKAPSRNNVTGIAPRNKLWNITRAETRARVRTGLIKYSISELLIKCNAIPRYREAERSRRGFARSKEMYGCARLFRTRLKLARNGIKSPVNSKAGHRGSQPAACYWSRKLRPLYRGNVVAEVDKGGRLACAISWSMRNEFNFRTGGKLEEKFRPHPRGYIRSRKANLTSATSPDVKLRSSSMYNMKI